MLQHVSIFFQKHELKVSIHHSFILSKAYLKKKKRIWLETLFWDHSDAYLFCYFSHRLNTCSIQMVVILPSFNEFMFLDIFFHLLSWSHKMIISSIYLIISFWSSCIFNRKELEEVFNIKRHNKAIFYLKNRFVKFTTTEIDLNLKSDNNMEDE